MFKIAATFAAVASFFKSEPKPSALDFCTGDDSLFSKHVITDAEKACNFKSEVTSFREVKNAAHTLMDHFRHPSAYVGTVHVD